jgi:hypothetical protein
MADDGEVMRARDELRHAKADGQQQQAQAFWDQTVQAGRTAQQTAAQIEREARTETPRQRQQP